MSANWALDDMRPVEGKKNIKKKKNGWKGHVEEDWQTSFTSTSILRVILPMSRVAALGSGYCLILSSSIINSIYYYVLIVVKVSCFVVA